MVDTKERIIQKALFYFAEHDYEGSSLNDIAKALGITKGGIYHYFESKDVLFKEAAIFGLRNALKFTLPEDNTISLKEIIHSFYNPAQITAHISKEMGFDFLKSYENMYYLIFASIKKFQEVRDELDKMYSEIKFKLEKMIKKAQSRNEIKKDIDPETLAYEIIAFGEGNMLVGSILTNFKREEMGELVFQALWKRIAAP